MYFVQAPSVVYMPMKKIRARRELGDLCDLSTYSLDNTPQLLGVAQVSEDMARKLCVAVRTQCERILAAVPTT